MQIRASTQEVAAPAMAEVQSPADVRRRDRRYFAALLLIVLALYLLLYNGFWSPGADTAFYIGLGRSLALHDFSLKSGCFFNENFQARCPPFWPLLLAAGMKISPAFWFLNLLPLGCMLLSIGMWYWCVRRLVPPGKAFWTVLTSATLFWWYSSSNQLRTEALYLVFFTWAMLLSWQIAEGRSQWWRIALLLLACFAMVSTRWAALTCWMILAAVLVSGRWPLPRRQWVALALSGVVMLGSFVGWRWLLIQKLPPPAVVKEKSAKILGMDTPDSSDEAPSAQELIPVKRKVKDYVNQVVNAGTWLTGIFWMPTQVTIGSKTPDRVNSLLGYLLVAGYVGAVVRMWRTRQWILLGLGIYCLSVVIRWRGSNPRYFMPVAPLLLLGIWVGFEEIASRRGRIATVFRWCAPVFLGSVLICNLAMLAVDAYVSRSESFYRLYYAGEAEDLVAAARYLDGVGVKDREVAVSAQYINMGRLRGNGFAERGLVLLTDRSTDVVPPKVCKDEPNPELIEWALRKGVRYYVYRPPVSPWRAWHFRIRWVQKLLDKGPIVDHPNWQLYKIEAEGSTNGTKGRAELVPIPPSEGWPTRVPGL